MKGGGPGGPVHRCMPGVGAVGAVKYEGLPTPVEPTFYLPFRQNTDTAQFVVVRAASDPRALATAVRGAVAALDKELPVANVKTMDELMTESVAPPRFRTTLVAVFALIGLVLAAIGIYGVMAYAVSERTHEIGIRAALGADRADVLRVVLRETAVLAAAGGGAWPA